jgi:hypothetical protein
MEVVAQLPEGDKYCIKQLVDLQVPCLGIVEDLIDVVHWSLDRPNSPRGVPGIYLHRHGLGELPIFWIRKGLISLGPHDHLVIRA